MRTFFDIGKQFPTTGLAAFCGLLLVGCLLTDPLREEATLVWHPFVGAPVTAAIDGKTLIIANNTDEPIYHRAFPTDILPVIEWAPCLAPEVCPDESRIEPGGQKSVAVNSIVRAETESITVFWWIYLSKLPGASIPPMEMDEFVVPLP